MPLEPRSDTFTVDGPWKAHYHEQGYVIIAGLLDESVLAQARRGCEALVDELAQRLLEKGAIQDVCADSPFDRRLMDLCAGCPSELPNLFRAELHRAEFFGLLCDRGLLDVVSALLPEAERIRIFPNYSARPKTPAKVHDVVWHQDAGLRGDGGPSTAPVAERLDCFGVGSVVNVWTPLVPARASNGCMKVIPKSHDLGILEHALVGSYGGTGAGGAALPDDGVDGFDSSGRGETAVPPGSYMTAVRPAIMQKIEADALSVELDPGSVLLFSNILVHRGGENASDRIRWSFDFRFQDAAKSTCRAFNGHIVRGPGAVETAQGWAALRLE